MKPRLLSLTVIFLLTLQVSSWADPESVGKMEKRIKRAVEILNEFKGNNRINPRILANAKGVAILESTKGGFIVSGTGGQGLVVVRTPSGWSAPSAISTGAVGFGFQAGVENTEMVLILNDDMGIEAFSQEDKFSLGSNASVAAGPDHMGTEYQTTSPADIYSYKKTDGAFAGAAVMGTFISEDRDINYQFYGKRFDPADILSDKVPAPDEAEPLYNALNEASSRRRRPSRRVVETEAREESTPRRRTVVTHTTATPRSTFRSRGDSNSTTTTVTTDGTITPYTPPDYPDAQHMELNPDANQDNVSGAPNDPDIDCR